MKWLCAFAFVLPFVFWGITRTVKYISYEVNCGGHLKRAGDANTVDLAAKELETALTYLEENGMTEGRTSLVFHTPDCDVSFWYLNLKSAHDELKKVSTGTTQLEKTNILMKLRETLLDSGDKGETVVTAPDGITVFPNNWAFAIWGWLGLLLLIPAVGFGWAAAEGY